MEEEKNRYVRLLDAIEAERKEEENHFLHILNQTSKQNLMASGVLLKPLQLLGFHYTLGERIEIAFERTKFINESHRFKIGLACVIKVDGLDDFNFKGSISYLKREKIRIILNQSEINFDDFPPNRIYEILMVYDERPYKIMKEAILSLIQSKNHIHQELRDGIAKKHDFPFSMGTNKPIKTIGLNPSQINAVKNLRNIDRIGIIHGPPGTGKTTTIIALVEELLQSEKRILVCAPSNNAVDLLAYRLDQRNISVIRIGNITRINDNIGYLTLDEKTRNHEEWNHIKKVKIEAEEARKHANTFKRHFGPQERAERKSFYREAKELRKWAKDLEERLVEKIIEKSQVICATLIGVNSQYTNELRFNTVIIDEASQALEPECWNAILKANRVILVGDHLQLPPTVKSNKAINLGLEETLLNILSNKIKHSYLLDRQYRMNDDILAFSNLMFYNGKLHSDDKVKNWCLPGDSEPFVLIDTSGCGFEELYNYENKSLSNPGEFFVLREYLLQISEKLAGFSIGIISPYAQQVKYIKSEIEEDQDLSGYDIRINTVDGFQGQERDAIFLSLVRSNSNHELGFVKDFRRLNVAMTRAKKKLVIVGDFSTLSNEKLFSDLIRYVEKNGAYKSAWEFMAY